MSLRKPPKNDAQLELFTAVFKDISSRDSRDSMEYPFLSLTKQKRITPIEFKNKNAEIRIIGTTEYGIANIWDWDLMIWLLSQIRQSIDSGEGSSRKVRFQAYSFLKSVRRSTGGRGYQLLEDALKRLQSTTIETTIRAEKINDTKKSKRGRTTMFHWIEYVDYEKDQNGNVTNIIVTLPEWVYQAACDQQLILSLHPDYFLLTGGMEKWIYRLVRKSYGANKNPLPWKFSTLHERYPANKDSVRPFKKFSFDLRKIIEKGTLLDYKLKYEKKDGIEYLSAVQTQKTPIAPDISNEVLIQPIEDYSRQNLKVSDEALDQARKVAPGYSIQALLVDWQYSTKKKNIKIENPDAAFLGWCRAAHKNNPLRIT